MLWSLEEGQEVAGGGSAYLSPSDYGSLPLLLCSYLKGLTFIQHLEAHRGQRQQTPLYSKSWALYARYKQGCFEIQPFPFSEAKLPVCYGYLEVYRENRRNRKMFDLEVRNFWNSAPYLRCCKFSISITQWLREERQTRMSAKGGYILARRIVGLEEWQVVVLNQLHLKFDVKYQIPKVQERASNGSVWTIMGYIPSIQWQVIHSQLLNNYHGAYAAMKARIDILCSWWP